METGLEGRAVLVTEAMCNHGGASVQAFAGERFDWEEKDTFVVPSWAWHEHVAEVESCLFSYNDSPMLRPFGLYREEGYIENDGHQPVTGASRAQRPEVNAGGNCSQS